MNKSSKFVFISVGGLVALMVVGMLISVFMDVSPEEIKEANLIDKWMWYRVAFYIFIISLWKSICVYLTRARFNLSSITDEDLTEYKKNREKDLRFLVSQRWKIVVLFAFFEIVIIQQFGL